MKGNCFIDIEEERQKIKDLLFILEKFNVSESAYRVLTVCRMVVEFTTTCAIVAYHHLSSEFEPHSWRGVLDKTLCDKVCQ
jgi:5-formyltetrahydrofolate cyclo-ligase